VSTALIDLIHVNKPNKLTSNKTERKPTQKVAKKRKKEPSLDINKAALVFGSVSQSADTSTEQPSESTTVPPSPHTEDVSSEQQKEEPKQPSTEDPKKQQNDDNGETDTSTPEISEDKTITQLKTEDKMMKKSPNRTSSSSRHIGKRVKKKTQRNRLTSAPSVGIIPSEKTVVMLEGDNIEEVSTSSSARTSFDTKE